VTLRGAASMGAFPNAAASCRTPELVPAKGLDFHVKGR